MNRAMVRLVSLDTFTLMNVASIHHTQSVWSVPCLAPVPCIVDGRVAVGVGRARVSPVHGEQLALRQLPGFGRHMQWRVAFLLSA